MTISEDELEYIRAASKMVDLSVAQVGETLGLDDEQACEWANSNMETFLSAIGKLCMQLRVVGIREGIIENYTEEQP